MNKQEKRFWARMFENCPEMSPDVMQGWIENPKALQMFLSGLVPEGESLTGARVQIKIEEGITNPQNFFKRYTGICMHYGFMGILNGVRDEKVTHDEMLISYIVPTEDALSVSMLPNSCVFEDIDIFLISLETLIRGRGKYSGKRDTFLTENGRNIFFVKVHEDIIGVYIVWFDEYGHWLLNTFDDELRGSRLYFPTAP